MAAFSPLPQESRFSTSDFALTVLAGFSAVLVVALIIAPFVDRETLLISSLFGQYAGHLLGLWFVLRRRGSTFGALGLQVEPSDGVYLFAGVALQFLIVLAFTPIAQWMGADESTQALAEQIPDLEGAVIRALLVLSVALVAPVTEELMFRGLLPKVLGRWMGEGLSFTVAALVFAVFHLVGVSGENFAQSLVLLVPQLFIVGLVLGWQARRRRRLGVAIFVHSGFNLVAVLALLFAPDTFT